MPRHSNELITEMEKLELNFPFDKTKYLLGKLCIRNHSYNNSNFTLRLIGNGGCVICRNNFLELLRKPAKENQKQLENKMQLVAAEFPFDASKYRLGGLCKRSHSYNNSSFTLRRVIGYTCIKCNNDKVLAHNQKPENKRKRSLYKKSDHAKALNKKYKQSDLAKATDVRWRSSKKCLQYQQVYQAKRRALKKTLSCGDYTKDDILAVFSKFNNMCAYCGEVKPLTIDHFIPLTKGGLDSIENIIPSCKPCNSSKGNREAEAWFKLKPFFSWDRLSTIYSYLSKV